MTGTAIADLSHIPVSQGLSTTLARASEGARASGAPEVSLEHVLAALCDDADAADVLTACAIDPARLKGDVIRFLVQQTGGAAQPVIGPVTVSPALVRILEAAAAAARGGRRRDINGAIVLAAIVGDARSFAAQILQEHGLTFDDAIKALQAVQTQPPRAPAAELPPPAEDVLARARERVQSRAAPSLREMMARPQLAERPAPPQGFQDIVPSPAAAQNWPQAAAETTPAPVPEPMPTEAAVPSDAAIAPEPEAELAVAPNEAASVPRAEPAAAASPDFEVMPPPAHAEAQAPAPQPSTFEPPPAAPAPSAGPQAPASGPSVPPNPFPPAGGSAEPRWVPAGDLRQMPAPAAAPPPPPVEQHHPAGAPPPGSFPGNNHVHSAGPGAPSAPSNVPAPGPFPSAPAFDPPLGGIIPSLAGAPPHTLPPLPHAPPPPGYRPANQGFAPSPPAFPPPPPAAGPPPPFSPFPPSGPPVGPPRSGPPPFGFEGGRQGPTPPPIPPALPGAPAPKSNPYGVPTSVSAPQMAPPLAAPTPPAARSAATPPPRRDAAAQAELGQLAENIPRTMRAGVTERVEIRLARAHVHDLTGGMDGGGLAWRHDVTVTKAMSVRIRAPEGGFFIETASPETQWIDNQLLDAGEDYASWRFLITPQQRGWSELQIVVSARTVGSDGLAAETAFPDQHIDIKVRTNYGRAALKGLGWAAAAIAGGAIAKFGEGAFDAGSTLVAKLLG